MLQQRECCLTRKTQSFHSDGIIDDEFEAAVVVFKVVVALFVG
jgi:hypothetical protein